MSATLAPATETTSRVLYAFVQCGTEVPEDLAGIDGAQLELIEHGDIAAVASSAPEGKLRPQRRKLKAYQQVIEAFQGRTPMLPVAFGVVSESRDSVASMLEANYEELHGKIEQIGRGVEMSLSLASALENPMEFLLTRNEDLRAERDALLAAGGGTHEQQVQIGTRLEEALGALREECTATVEEFLGSVAKDFTPLDHRSPKELSRHAILVEYSEVERFEASLGKLAERFDDNYAINYDGPWPPYSFTKLQLTEPGAE